GPDPIDQLGQGEPALHRQILSADLGRLEVTYSAVRQSIASGPESLDLTLLEAVLSLRAAEWPAEPLATLLQTLSLPILHAFRRSIAVPDEALQNWQAGICPTCGAWPAIAESRGLERIRVLRCGRCGSGWTLPWQLCPFCANDDHRAMGYIFTEESGEARRVFTCDGCHGFLKTIATHAAIDPLLVAAADLETIALDVVALEHSFAKPPEPGFALDVRIATAPLH
ncbi:MAG: formate dehydrogenase accessory protein FdhE, partial [Chloroflexi bacterium]|nr:formate dehydrogenase accessory protein FdhE [Chloroflexota bacterium]